MFSMDMYQYELNFAYGLRVNVACSQDNNTFSASFIDLWWFTGFTNFTIISETHTIKKVDNESFLCIQ